MQMFSSFAFWLEKSNGYISTAILEYFNLIQKHVWGNKPT